MAHGFLQSFDKRVEVYSAGIDASGKLNSDAVKAMAEIGIDIRSRIWTDDVANHLLQFEDRRNYCL